jgi:predicted ATP-dependent serine protease
MRKISNTNRKKFIFILPVCGEESDQQVRLTAQRSDSTPDKINEPSCYSPAL